VDAAQQLVRSFYTKKVALTLRWQKSYSGKNVAVAKTSHGINVVVAQTSFLFRGGTNVGFLGIGGT